MHRPDDSTFAELQRTVLAEAAMAFAGVPGVEVIDEGDLVRSFAPGRPQPYLNAIARLDPGAGADTDAFAHRVREVERPYRDAGLPTIWWIDDGARSGDLVRTLGVLGLRDPGGEAVMAMRLPSPDADAWPDPDAWRAHDRWPADPAAIETRVVRTMADLDRWIEVIAGSYGWTDPARAAVMRELYDPRQTHGRDERRIQVLGLLGGVPVSAASLFRTAGQGWVTNVGTIPAARGRGAGGAVTVACLRLAIQRGDPTAWLAASAMGEPVYARLGFRTVGRLEHLIGPAPLP